MLVIGVESTSANAMAQALAEGQRITLSKVDAFADGTAVKQVHLPLPLLLPSLLLLMLLVQRPLSVRKLEAAMVVEGRHHPDCQHPQHLASTLHASWLFQPLCRACVLQQGCCHAALLQQDEAPAHRLCKSAGSS